MGGSAMQKYGITTKRADKETYDTILSKVVRILDEFQVRNHPVISYASKIDFGDIDILVESDTFSKSGALSYLKEIAAKEIVDHNGNVFSMSIDCVQVDFICLPYEDIEFSGHYFGNNDFGNLLGRVSHRMGFKLAHDGLYYIFRVGDYVFREILVSKDFRRVLSFIGYNDNEYKEQFDTLEEMFQFVANGDYFHPDIYLLENRNSVSRIRDKKRKTYNAFLKWVETAQTTRFDGAPKVEIGGRKECPWAMQRAYSMFPEFKSRIEKATIDYTMHADYKAKFSGGLVIEVTGLSGKEVSIHIEKLYNMYGGKDGWKKFVLCNDQDTIKKAIIGVK